MTQKLTQNSEEIWKYQAEHVVVLSRVRELVGHPGGERQQGESLRPANGVSRSVFSMVDSPDFGKVLPLYERCA